LTKLFRKVTPSLENYWRSIILFGRNVASYKFALGEALIKLESNTSDLITLEQLAAPYSDALCRHLGHSEKQITSSGSRFIGACKEHNAKQISRTQLIEQTVSLGFQNVIDAFHVVHDGEIEKRFFLDERKRNKGIRLTDNYYQLMQSLQKENLMHEVESRWRLVETAWELKVPRTVLPVHFDQDNLELFTLKGTSRKAITGCRDALNGYQRGKCFYCFREITVSKGSTDLADVDHFFPHVLKAASFLSNLDGIWNLVLSCRDCNRGEEGKFIKVPELNCLERLHTRNEYLIGSSLPLREVLCADTGHDTEARVSFLNSAYRESLKLLITTWKPVHVFGTEF
jgi:hypothetical protein